MGTDTKQYEFEANAYGKVIKTEYGNSLEHVKYKVLLKKDSITVDGKTLPVKHISGLVYKLMKRSLRIDLSDWEIFEPMVLITFTDDFWISNSDKIIKHVLQFGK